MDTADLNKILLHTIPSGWAEQYYIQGWGFEGNTCKEICGMFEIMKVAKQIYKGGPPSKTISQTYATHSGHRRKRIGEKPATLSNHEKFPTGLVQSKNRQSE